MKKVLSIFIAMLLLVSLFATTAVAFAEGEEQTTYALKYAVGDNGTGDAPAETKHAKDAEVTLGSATTFKPKKGYEFDCWSDGTASYQAGAKFTMPDHDVTLTAQWKVARTVTIDSDKLFAAFAEDEDFNTLKYEMDDHKFGVKLMDDPEKIREIFSGIKYLGDKEEETDTDKKANNDKIYVEYCRPSESPKGQENWQNSSLITSNIRLNSSGWYLFRIVVKDSTEINTLGISEKFGRYVEDSKHPVVSLSTSMNDKVKNGLTVGTKYTVSTSLSITDSSSTTVTYKIYKWVKGAWTTDPIYDSTTKEVAKGYEKFVDSNGAITPSKDDVSEKPVYKIVYAVVDANGYVGVEKDDSTTLYEPFMELFVNPADETKSNTNVWQIVLYCIAGLSAVGIVVLLCIKPKEAAPAGNVKAADKDKEAAEPDETLE